MPFPSPLTFPFVLCLPLPLYTLAFPLALYMLYVPEVARFVVTKGCQVPFEGCEACL